MLLQLSREDWRNWRASAGVLVTFIACWAVAQPAPLFKVLGLLGLAIGPAVLVQEIANRVLLTETHLSLSPRTVDTPWGPAQFYCRPRDPRILTQLAWLALFGLWAAIMAVMIGPILSSADLSLGYWLALVQLGFGTLAVFLLGFPAIWALGLRGPGGIYLTATHLVDDYRGVRIAAPLSLIDTQLENHRDRFTQAGAPTVPQLKVTCSDPTQVTLERIPIWTRRVNRGEFLIHLRGLEAEADEIAQAIAQATPARFTWNRPDNSEETYR